MTNSTMPVSVRRKPLEVQDKGSERSPFAHLRDKNAALNRYEPRIVFR
jgi:hypothetical protein